MKKNLFLILGLFILSIGIMGGGWLDPYAKCIKNESATCIQYPANSQERTMCEGLVYKKCECQYWSPNNLKYYNVTCP